jgi:hypothetical protein
MFGVVIYININKMHVTKDKTKQKTLQYILITLFYILYVGKQTIFKGQLMFVNFPEWFFL